MWKSLSLVAIAVTTAACTQPPTTDPVLDVDADPTWWFESEPITVHVEWPAEVDCSDDGWDCSTGPLPVFSLTAASCDGCTLSDLPSGEMENATELTMVATTTDAITLSATVASDGVSHTLTATATGDREVALQVACSVLRTDLLDESVIDDSELVPCGATHTADQTVVLSPYITTVHGSDIFPFCPDDAVECSPDYARKTSSIAITGAAYVWNVRDFVTLTDATSAHQVTVTAPLADGSLSTASVATPALAAQ